MVTKVNKPSSTSITKKKKNNKKKKQTTNTINVNTLIHTAKRVKIYDAQYIYKNGKVECIYPDAEVISFKDDFFVFKRYVNVVSDTQTIESKKKILQFKCNAKMLAKLKCKYIVSFKGFFVKTNSILSLYDSITGKPLAMVLHQHSLSVYQIYCILFQICYAMILFYKYKIFYGRLHINKIFITSTGVKLLLPDLDQSLKDCTMLSTPINGDLELIKVQSMDCINNDAFLFHSDIWSFGLLCWSMFSKESPFQHIINVVHLKIHLIQSRVRTEDCFPDQLLTKCFNNYVLKDVQCPSVIRRLFINCLDTNPCNRYNWHKIRNVILNAFYKLH